LMSPLGRLLVRCHTGDTMAKYPLPRMRRDAIPRVESPKGRLT
jgi:hypothetical protein